MSGMVAHGSWRRGPSPPGRLYDGPVSGRTDQTEVLRRRIGNIIFETNTPISRTFDVVLLRALRAFRKQWDALTTEPTMRGHA